MKVVYENAKVFANIITGLKKVTDEVTFVFTEEGIRIAELDPSRVMFVSVFIPRNIFETYDDEEGQVEFSVDLDELAKYLRRAKKEPIMLEYDGDMVKVTFMGSARRTFKLQPIDRERTSVEIPELPFNAKVLFKVDMLKDIIKDASLISDSITFSRVNDRIVGKASGTVYEYEFEIPDEDVHFVNDEEFSVSVGINYLENIVRLLNVTDTVEVMLGDDLPVLIRGSLFVDGEISVLIAPRVEE